VSHPEHLFGAREGELSADRDDTISADQARPLLGHAVTFRGRSGPLRTVFMAAFASYK
jgi:hypothetical protein